MSLRLRLQRRPRMPTIPRPRKPKRGIRKMARIKGKTGYIGTFPEVMISQDAVTRVAKTKWKPPKMGERVKEVADAVQE